LRRGNLELIDLLETGLLRFARKDGQKTFCGKLLDGPETKALCRITI
jgi:hypothetical protein